MNFATIGTGNNKISKNGLGYIAITLDGEAFKKVYPEDYGKLCLFKNTYKGVGFPDYRLMAPLNEPRGREKIAQDLAECSNKAESQSEPLPWEVNNEK